MLLAGVPAAVQMCLNLYEKCFRAPELALMWLLDSSDVGLSQ